MDNLQHIDDLLRQASQVPANALVNDSDWAVVEKKLKRRKNRIYAMWFFLALVSVSSVGLLFHHNNQFTNNPTILAQTEESLPLEDINRTKLPENTKSTSANSVTINIKTDNPNFSGTNKPKDLIPTDIAIDKSFDKETTTPITAETANIETETPVVFSNNTPIEPITLEPKRSNSLLVLDVPLNKLQLLAPTKLDEIATSTSTINSNLQPLSPNHWEFGVSFTPGLSNKLTSENNSLRGLINRSYYDKVAKSETSSFANTFGFNAQYHTEKWFLASGIFMTQRSEQINYDYQITEYPTVNNNTNAIDTYTTLNPLAFVSINYSGSNSYHFMEIPLSIGYKTSFLPNFELRSQIGVSYLSLINREGKKGNFTTLELDNIKDLKFNQHNIAANVKTGLYWNKPRFVIGIEPLLGVNLNSLRSTETSAIKTKPYGYGLNITSAIKLFKL